MKFLSISEVIARVSISRATIYRQLAEGDFPKPVRISMQRVAFVEKEIDDWIAAKIAENRAA
jgi:prophage regulatory protein